MNGGTAPPGTAAATTMTVTAIAAPSTAGRAALRRPVSAATVPGGSSCTASTAAIASAIPGVRTVNGPGETRRSASAQASDSCGARNGIQARKTNSVVAA